MSRIIKDKQGNIIIDYSNERPGYDVIYNKLIDKPFVFKGEKFIVDDVDADENDIILYLTNDENDIEISILTILNNKGSFEDNSLNDYIKSIAKFYGAYENDERWNPKEKVEEEPIEHLVEKAKAKAHEDFFNKNSEMYNYLNKKFKQYGRLDEDENAYLTEYVTLKYSPIANKKRRNKQTIGATYTGDVDELITWLKKAITSIEIIHNGFDSSNLDPYIRELNKRDGTNYEPTITNQENSYEMDSYIARLTTKPEILAEMPEEVKTWVAYKNPGNIHSEKKALPVLNENKLTSNGIVEDLLDNYGFKLGKQ